MELSLKRSAGRVLVASDVGLEVLDETKPRLTDVKPLLNELFCKENLPDFYRSCAQVCTLEKRHAREKPDEHIKYLDDQATYPLGDVCGMTFVGNTSTAVIFGKSGALQWWDTVLGNLLNEQNCDQVYEGSVSSSNGCFVGAISDTTCVIWSAVTYLEVSSFDYEERLSCVEFSQDGSYLVVVSRAGKVIIRDFSKQETVAEFSGTVTSKIHTVRMAADTVYLLSENVVTAWDYKTNTFVTSVIVIGYARCTYSKLAADNVILCLSDSSIKLFSLKDGSQKLITFDTNTIHEGQLRKTVIRPITCCEFSVDGSLLILGEAKRTSLWRRKKGDQLTYQFIGGFNAARDISYLALRNDDLAFLVAEKQAGLQLCMIDNSLENLSFIDAKEVLVKRQKPANGLKVGLPVDWYLKPN